MMTKNKESFYSIDTERNTINEQRRKQIVAEIPLTIQRNLLSVYFKYCYFVLLATLSIIRAQITNSHMFATTLFAIEFQRGLLCSISDHTVPFFQQFQTPSVRFAENRNLR